MGLLRATRPSAVCRILGTLDPLGLPSALAALTSDELGGSGVEFLPTVPFPEVHKRISAHSVGWLTWPRCAANLYGTPTKLLEYMAAGLPVVVSDLPLVTQIVHEADCGLVVPWDSPAAHAGALSRLLANLGTNGRRAVLERLNWETQRDALVSFYESFLDRAVTERVSSRAELA